MKDCPLYKSSVWAILIVLSSITIWAQDNSENSHWSFRSPSQTPIPLTKTPAWVRNPIDAFILAELEKKGEVPSPRTTELTLLRRLYFDLTGLPPTPAEVSSFLNDPSEHAYEKLVDHLLASPRYGERWAQHWLDVVRYADSDGFEYDDPRPNAWRYRDWVIDSFNQDKPYALFVQEQIAGDQMFPENPAAIIATGLHRLGPLRLNAGNQDEKKNRQEVLTEMTDMIGSAFLGITVGCARCHDHKFDPVAQSDYYQLQAFFAPTFPKDIVLASPEERRAYQQQMTLWNQKVEELAGQIRSLEMPYRSRLEQEKKANLSNDFRLALAIPEKERNEKEVELAKQGLRAIAVTDSELVSALQTEHRAERTHLLQRKTLLEQNKPADLPQAMAVTDASDSIPETHILRRGDPGSPLEEVSPSFPVSLSSLPDHNLTGALDHAGARRTQLGRWLTKNEHPLTARVMVNRIWQHHFSRGLVETPNDFGHRGQAPTHPELLDWLATKFITGNWSIKSMHRLIVLSATYQQTSYGSDESQRLDPQNKRYSRFPRRRLDAEEIRDSLLMTAGNLETKVGGPGVFVPLNDEVTNLIYKGSWQATSDPKEHLRRSIYLFLKRNVRIPLMENFDSPSTMTSCGQRHISTHSGQALSMINSPFLNDQASVLAARLWEELEHTESPLNALVQNAYQRVLSRQPTSREQELSSAFIMNQAGLEKSDCETLNNKFLSDSDSSSPNLKTALTDFCLVLFNLDEFMYIH